MVTYHKHYILYSLSQLSKYRGVLDHIRWGWWEIDESFCEFIWVVMSLKVSRDSMSLCIQRVVHFLSISSGLFWWQSYFLHHIKIMIFALMNLLNLSALLRFYKVDVLHAVTNLVIQATKLSANLNPNCSIMWNMQGKL